MFKQLNSRGSVVKVMDLHPVNLVWCPWHQCKSVLAPGRASGQIVAVHQRKVLLYTWVWWASIIMECTTLTKISH